MDLMAGMMTTDTKKRDMARMTIAIHTATMEGTTNG